MQRCGSRPGGGAARGAHDTQGALRWRWAVCVCRASTAWLFEKRAVQFGQQSRNLSGELGIKNVRTQRRLC